MERSTGTNTEPRIDRTPANISRGADLSRLLLGTANGVEQFQAASVIGSLLNDQRRRYSTMGKRHRQRRKRATVQPKRAQKLTTKQRWITFFAFVGVFGLTLIPYAVDLVQKPNLHNGVLLCLMVAGFVFGVIMLLRYL